TPKTIRMFAEFERTLRNAADLDHAMDHALTTALTHTLRDKGNIQLVDWDEGCLCIVAQRLRCGISQYLRARAEGRGKRLRQGVPRTRGRRPPGRGERPGLCAFYRGGAPCGISQRRVGPSHFGAQRPRRRLVGPFIHAPETVIERDLVPKQVRGGDGERRERLLLALA